MCVLIPETWAVERTFQSRRGFMQRVSASDSSRDVLQAGKALSALCPGVDSCTCTAWHSFLPWSFPHRPRGLRILGLQVKLNSAKVPEPHEATRITPHKCFKDFQGSLAFTPSFVSWLTQIQLQMRYCLPLWLCHRREGGQRKKKKPQKMIIVKMIAGNENTWFYFFTH